MSRFVRGLIVGALIPGYMAYKYHSLLQEHNATVAVAQQYVQQMDTQAAVMTRGLRLWKIGGEYDLVHEKLERAVQDYLAASAQYKKLQDSEDKTSLNALIQ